MCKTLIVIISLVILTLCGTTLLVDYENDIPLSRTKTQKPIKIYWNIPTFQCHWHKLNFTNLAEKYNIFQNEDDRFRGEDIAILYDPGNFPAILKNGSATFLRNGGVPQAGNLTEHLEIFLEILEDLIPDKNFSGLGIIDFESWRPVFRQNFNALAPYKEISIEIERKKHPLWPDSWIEKEASRRFEEAAKKFMEETVIIAQLLRPKASWGYYAYPYCFNMSPNNMRQACPKEVQEENNRVQWLYSMSDVLYPSIYLGKRRLNAKERVQLVKGRIEEAQRLQRNIKKKIKPKIVAYFWYKYNDADEFLTKEDTQNILRTLQNYDVDGMVIWGSSNDVNTKTKCVKLYHYLDDVLGPARMSVSYT